MKAKHSIFLLGFIILLIACSRDDEEMFLPEAEITINSPASNSFIKPGDTIYIEGMATCATSLHGYELSIKMKEGANLYFQHFHDHDDTLRIQDKWKNIVSQPGELELIVSVILDHYDHRKNKIIPLQVR